jgi:hypothetical protein
LVTTCCRLLQGTVVEVVEPPMREVVVVLADVVLLEAEESGTWVVTVLNGASVPPGVAPPGAPDVEVDSLGGMVSGGLVVVDVATDTGTGTGTVRSVGARTSR